jgi:hypothetical protein
MMVKCYGSEFEVPDLLVNKFLKDFETLPGSGYREGVYQLRDTINEILDVVADEPDILHEPEYHTDFIRALAMKQAMGELGIFLDS